MTRKNKSTEGRKKNSGHRMKLGSSRTGNITEYFDATLYSNAVLKRSAKAFSELVTIEIQREGKYRKVTFKSVRAQDMPVIADEFANYALSCLVVET